MEGTNGNSKPKFVVLTVDIQDDNTVGQCSCCHEFYPGCRPYAKGNQLICAICAGKDEYRKYVDELLMKISNGSEYHPSDDQKN